MSNIEPHIQKYINRSVDVAEKRFDKKAAVYVRQAVKEANRESKRHMEALIEHVDQHMGEFYRVVSSLPTEERVREIFHEQIKPFDIKLNLCISEIGKLNGRVDKLETKVDNLDAKFDIHDKKFEAHDKKFDHISELVNSHELRLADLETDYA
ncbi:MAG: hypothetical protein KGJ35_02075 [Patescibacteria group bacterium]|nr:hypothetical protein [Patescibacteria group bacterium]